MASGLDLTAFDSVLKQHYISERVRDTTYKNNPWYALVPKYTNFGGRNLPIVLKYGNPQGRSKTFSTAQTRSTAQGSKYEDFLLTRVKDYSLATIDGETLLASKGDANAFIEAATNEIDGALLSLTRSLAINMFRDTSAYRGQVNAEPSEVAGFTITLKNIQDITNFEVNHQIVMYSAKTGGSLRTYDGTNSTMVITAVDRNAGTFTIGGSTYTASGTIAADDYIFINGDRGLGLAGFEAWVPSSAPSATTFFGVDRTPDVVRLGGNRLTATGVPIEEALIEADAQVSREGGMMDHFFMNHKNLAKLKKALGSKVQYVDLVASPKVSFQGVLVDGENGPIKCVADKNCPAGFIAGMQMDTWKLCSIGDPVRVVDADGLNMLRQASDDGVEYRAAFYGNLGCWAPAYNINVTI